MNNYLEVYSVLNSLYPEVEGSFFYKELFPNNQNKGVLNDGAYNPNAIYLYSCIEDKENKRLFQRVMFNDTWKEDYIKYVVRNPFAICSGLSYIGRKNISKNARKMHALIIDLDEVGENEIKNLLHRYNTIWDDSDRYITLPPTFLALSGTGLHIYYVFDEPIDLTFNNRIMLKNIKDRLTKSNWDPGCTSKLKKIQYQSINQSFRMIGSLNNKKGKENVIVRAFKIGERVTIESVQNLTQNFSDFKTKEKLYKIPIAESIQRERKRISLKKAKIEYPEWYQRRIVLKKPPTLWNVSRNVYDWWKGKADDIEGGHRYFYMMCLAIYAKKCDISREELEKDSLKVFDILTDVEHINPLEDEDRINALKAYDRDVHSFTIHTIEKLTGLRIKRNRRNYRKQKDHLALARAIQNVIYPNGEWRNKKGSPSKKKLVLEYIEEYPTDNISEIARNLNISFVTAHKYAGPQRKIKYKKPTKEKLVKDYIEKHPTDNITEIAKALNISRPTVYKYINPRD